MRSHDCLRFAAVIGLCALVVSSAPTAAAPAAHPSSGLEQGEQPDDPPAPARTALTGSPAQPTVAAAASVQVNVNANGANILNDAANEPSIAVDPTHPNHIAIGWRQFDDISSNFRQAGWGYSLDGGRTWKRGGVLDPGVFRSDPVLGFDATGGFYYSSLTVDVGNYSCDVFRSDNGGASWGAAIYAFGGDKQWLNIDRSTGIGRGNIYQAWSVNASCCGNNVFTRSIDGGATYQSPTTLSPRPIWGTMDVAPNGALYLAGVDARTTSRILVAKSSSAQNSGLSPVFESIRIVDLGGGVSVFAGEGSPNPDGLHGQVWVAVDRSNGPTAGYVYLLCSVVPLDGDPLDVMFSRSTDGGTTWSAPVRVNDDPSGAWQWFGTLSVAPNGRLDVVWNDTRNSGLPNVSELFYSFSTNGGLAWSPNVRLSPAWDSHVGWPNQNKIGDYYHMISDRVGADLAWSATFNGEQDIWYLRINDRDCNGNGIGDATDIAQRTSHDWNQNGIPDECENLQVSDAESAPRRFRLFQNVPNPFNPETSIDFDAPQDGGRVSLQIYDVAGHRVRTLEGARRAGRNSWRWDGKNDAGEPSSSGIYVYRMTAPGFSDARRMVLVR